MSKDVTLSELADAMRRQRDANLRGDGYTGEAIPTAFRNRNPELAPKIPRTTTVVVEVSPGHEAPTTEFMEQMITDRGLSFEGVLDIYYVMREVPMHLLKERELNPARSREDGILLAALRPVYAFLLPDSPLCPQATHRFELAVGEQQ